MSKSNDDTLLTTDDLNFDDLLSETPVAMPEEIVTNASEAAPSAPSAAPEAASESTVAPTEKVDAAEMPASDPQVAPMTFSRPVMKNDKPNQSTSQEAPMSNPLMDKTPVMDASEWNSSRESQQSTPRNNEINGNVRESAEMAPRHYDRNGRSGQGGRGSNSRAPRRYDRGGDRNGGNDRYNGGQNQGGQGGQNQGGYNQGGYNQQQDGMDGGDRPHHLADRIKDDLKNSFPGKGILEITPSGFGFLRPGYTPSQNDIYVSQSQIRKFWLRPGDEVEGLVRAPKDNEKYHGLLKIEKVNGRAMTEDESRQRVNFDDMTSVYPNKQIKLETTQDILATRIMDLVSPIGFGQRGMVVSPPKAGKTTLLKQIATGITANFPDVSLIAILIGERPEEVTDLTRSIKAEVVSSHFDQSPRDQIRAAEIGLERAKRLVEEGKDVVILLDSITRLARAYNMSVASSGRTLSGGFDPAALYPAKKFLGAARNCEDSGSLTIIGTALVNTESRMDDLIYEEFKGTGNMELHLDRAYAEKRIYPAIDIEKSGTRHDELLFSQDVLDKVTTLRRMMALLDKDEKITVLTDKMAKTASNEAFLKELKIGK